MNVSEPLLSCRENAHPVKITENWYGEISTADILFTGRAAGVMKGA